MLFDTAIAPKTKNRAIFVIKWLASIIQILGYTATAFGWTPVNLHLLIAGVVGWFAVGVLWRDRAIMLIHIVALSALLAGMINGQSATRQSLEHQ